MADPFLAEIRIFPFTFAPRNWAFCNGALLPISQNTALFALLGTMYGGDGKSTFALPDLRDRAVMHPGQGPGLTPRDQGEMGGSESETLLISEIPSHSHQITASQSDSLERFPSGSMLATTTGLGLYTNATSPQVFLDDSSLPPSGGSVPHNNMQPFLTLNFNIALQGVFPSRP